CRLDFAFSVQLFEDEDNAANGRCDGTRLHHLAREVRDFTRKVIVLYLMEQSDEFRELSLLRDGITPKAMVISEHNVEMPIKVA
ncbi:hypothetical protein N7526_009820, partial [Penicillium atrosanguineum]